MMIRSPGPRVQRKLGRTVAWRHGGDGVRRWRGLASPMGNLNHSKWGIVTSYDRWHDGAHRQSPKERRGAGRDVEGDADYH